MFFFLENRPKILIYGDCGNEIKLKPGTIYKLNLKTLYKQLFKYFLTLCLPLSISVSVCIYLSISLFLPLSLSLSHSHSLSLSLSLHRTNIPTLFLSPSLAFHKSKTQNMILKFCSKIFPAFFEL